MAPLVLLGGHHALRLYLHYGTILPDALLIQKSDALAWNPFLRIVFSLERWQILAYLLLVFPLAVLPILPRNVKFFLSGLPSIWARLNST
jgi:hypothetical protein